MRKLKNEELERKSIQDIKDSAKIPITVVLDNVRSMNNVGSVFRTSDAFLIQEILLTGITSTPPHREIHKTALGATDTVEWKYFESIILAINYLKLENYTIVAVEQTTESISLIDFQPLHNSKYALIFGNEVEGVSQDALGFADFSLEIPQFGNKHSFNISVSVGIVLWDITSKLKYFL